MVGRWIFSAAMLAAFAILLILSAEPAAGASKNCAAGQTSSGSATQTPSPTTGQASKSALVPTPESKSLKWEFDGDRDETYWDVVIQANPPLSGIDPSEIDVTPGRMVRDDDHTAFKRPLLFTPPKISSNGKRVTFRLCADPRGIEAGTYKATVSVDGPGTVTGTTLDVSVTARSKWWFVGSLVIILGVVFVGLELKSIADYQRDIKGKKTPHGEPVKFKARDAVRYIWSWDELRVVTALIGIVTALISVTVLYNKDHTWGADWFTSILAGAQAAFVAVGAQGVLDGLRGAGSEATK
jgi:hypothetical protein